jgi:putative SOS response-associated peptidase YedK
MCNLYSLNKKRDMVARLFFISHNRAADYAPLPAIFPGHTAPVIRASADGERELVPMSWGFVLPQDGKAARRVTNVRDDKIMGSRFWRSSFEERRCLVPATSFCEPNGDVKPATWHWFAIAGKDARPLFAFPGIWRRYSGPLKKDGPAVEIETYSFLTTTPNPLVATINHERMPVPWRLLANFRLARCALCARGRRRRTRSRWPPDDGGDDERLPTAFPHPQAGSMAARPAAGYGKHCRSLSRPFPSDDASPYMRSGTLIGPLRSRDGPFSLRHSLSGVGRAASGAAIPDLASTHEQEEKGSAPSLMAARAPHTRSVQSGE